MFDYVVSALLLGFLVSAGMTGFGFMPALAWIIMQVSVYGLVLIYIIKMSIHFTNSQ